MKFTFKILSFFTFFYALSLLYTNHHLDTGVVILFVFTIVLYFLSDHYTPLMAFLNERRILKRMLFIFCSFFVFMILVFEGLMWKASHEPIPDDVNTMIVLGSGLKNGKPSYALQKRLMKAFTYYDEHSEMTIIVSGGLGFGEEKSEGEVMKDYLISLGVKETTIIAETRASSTFENLLFAKKLIPDFHDGQKVILVSNDFHLFRSKMIAKRLGFEPYGLPAKTPPHIVVQVHLREYLAIINSYFFNKI